MTITIAEHPVLVDFEGEAQAWLDRFLPEATIFKHPQVLTDTYLSGPKGTGEFFASSLPPLPPIQIGQIQWPCVGVSRFARALFLVDRVSLFGILNTAWGATIPSVYPYAIPESWVQTKNQAVAINLGPDFSIHLFLLLPIRVTDELWILPLVDGRYYGLNQPATVTAIDATKPMTTWAQYFTDLSVFRYDVAFVPEVGVSYGNPDPVMRSPRVPLAYAIDAACFSVGCRPVVPMGIVPNELEPTQILKVKCELPTTADAKKAVLLAQTKITGGKSGIAHKPLGIRIATRLVESYYSGENRAYVRDQFIGSGAGKGIVLFSRAVWNVHQPSSDPFTGFHDYTTAIANKIDYWNVDEYYVTLPEIVKLDPSGFDDYIIYENSGDKKTTTVRSLPIDFCAPFLLSQTPAGGESLEISYPTLWFHTQNQIVSARALTNIAGGIVTAGMRQGIFGTAQIIDKSLKFAGSGSNYAEAFVTVLNGQSASVKAGDLIYLKWVDDVYAGLAWEGWVITSAPPCLEKLEKFVMHSGWISGLALATFTLIEAVSPDVTATLEDPLGIFSDQLRYGGTGLSIRTCSGRHFVIQAKCGQTIVDPPAPLGCCVYGSPGSPSTAYTTEANCALVSGVWTAGPCE